jgi:nucleotide-binding universal stress UspA family protein
VAGAPGDGYAGKKIQENQQAKSNRVERHPEKLPPVHDQRNFMLKYSLVGYDGSASSQQAVRFALELARACGGRVRVVSVVQMTEGSADTCVLMMADPGAQRCTKLLQDLKDLAPDADALIDVEVVHGSPGDMLLDQVRRHRIDHIVIGHTARGALARWLLGSVSGEVLERAHVPVTVVR